MNRVMNKLRTAFYGWMLYDTYGFRKYTVHKDGLLFMVMADDDDSNFARVELINILEPNREKAHWILGELAEWAELQGILVHKYYHTDKTYSRYMLKSIDICGGYKKDYKL